MNKIAKKKIHILIMLLTVICIFSTQGSFLSMAATEADILTIQSVLCDVECDERCYLQGNITVNVKYNGSGTTSSLVTVYFVDTYGFDVASFESRVDLTKGVNNLTLSFSNLAADIMLTEGAVTLSYRVEIVDDAEHFGEKSGDIDTFVVATQPPTVSTMPEITQPPETTQPPALMMTPDVIVSPEPAATVIPDVTAVPQSTSAASLPTSGNAIDDMDSVTGVTMIKVNTKKLTMGVGESFQIKASVTSTLAVKPTLSYFTYNGNKLSVTKKGKITACSTGDCSVIVEASDGTIEVIRITVKEPPNKIFLGKSSKTLLRGRSYQIKVRFPKKTASQKLIYTSSKKKIASVSSTGKVTAKKKGKTKITVKTFNKKKASMYILVK